MFNRKTLPQMPTDSASQLKMGWGGNGCELMSFSALKPESFALTVLVCLAPTPTFPVPFYPLLLFPAIPLQGESPRTVPVRLAPVLSREGIFFYGLVCLFVLVCPHACTCICCARLCVRLCVSKCHLMCVCLFNCTNVRACVYLCVYLLFIQTHTYCM